MMTMHDGREVRKHTIKITNTGDGLSKSMNVDPITMHIGDKGYALIEFEKRGDGFEPIDGTEDLVLVHKLKAGTATIVGKEIAKPLIEAQIEKLIAHADEVSGAQQLPLGDKLAAQHREGAHKRKRKGCELCDEKSAAKQDELAQRRASKPRAKRARKSR